MLCDELLESLGSNKTEAGKLYRHLDTKGLDKFVAKLRAAQKFILTEDTFAMANVIRKGKPSSFLVSLDYAKPPYPLTWIEYQTSYKDGGSDIDEHRTHVPKTKRVGFLIEEISDKKLVVTMGYSYQSIEYEATINPLMVYFDSDITLANWQAAYDLTKDIFSDDDRAAAREDMESMGFSDITLPDREMECARKIEQMYMPTGNVYLINTLMSTQKAVTSKEFLLMNNQWTADWHGEMGIPAAVFILLNCRNAVEAIECEPLSQLNRARIKRGKLPLCEFKTLHLKLTEEQKTLARQSKEADAEIRLHWRRGHFKHRKTGLFWWNPHLAGRKDLGEIIKDYVA